MIPREIIEQQLGHTLNRADIPGLGDRLDGKVRDCYVRGATRILIASDRLSAFDVVLTTIPFKGQILSQLAAHWFDQTAHIVPNHVRSIPHPNVFVCDEVEIIPIEIVVRGYLAGSAWRDYQAGRPVSGISLPQGMRRSERLAQPLVTPSTKAPKGEHDEPISGEEIVRRRLVSPDRWAEVCDVALRLFEHATNKLGERGLILVDTKFEMGLRRGADGKEELVLADEILTPDSSRFWIRDSYEERFAAGEDPVMLDKEFVRRWLIERGYMGNGTPPHIPDSFRVDTALRYIEAFERITGQPFFAQPGDPLPAIKSALEACLGC